MLQEEELKEMILWQKRYINLYSINKLDLIQLNIDDFSDFETSYALNALASIYELLLYLGDNDDNHIFNISNLITKTIELKILDENDQISYEDVDNHTMLNNEFIHQLDFFKNCA